MEATKRPWTQERLLNAYGVKCAVENHKGVEIHSDGVHIMTIVDNEHDGYSPNIDLIVRAVNAHDALVAALEGLAKASQEASDTHHMDFAVNPEHWSDLYMAVMQARAALAQAKGE